MALRHFDMRDSIVTGYFYFRVSRLDITVPLQKLAREAKIGRRSSFMRLNEKFFHVLRGVTQKLKEKVIHYA